ncbi:MAG TPA: ribonuclease H [Polyangia bacterium]|nr:ribonuclease H [Polyangia bacterium]
MRFKDQPVWVRADDAGHPVLDGEGRAEMKYRETDPKSYRPALGNLMPDGGSGSGGAARADAQRARSGAPRPSAQRAAARKLASPRAASVAGAVEIWTDGACSGNPGPMGIGVVVIDGDTRRELGEYLGTGTNNIAELVAIERGIAIASELTKGVRERPLRVYSDSSYAIGLLEKGWKAKANQELVARIRQSVAACPRLSFVKVAGHAGVPENERCDVLARQAISRGLMP